MASPCPRCGHTKTESIRHGFIHDMLWNRGYHLRRCSFCNRWRLFRRADPTQRHPDDMTREELQEYFDQQIAKSLGKISPAPSATPEANMTSDSTEQPREFQAEENSSSIGLAEKTEEIEDYRLCPKCGSPIFRRSHRRWYEKLMGRRKMARCMKCDHRFPYPH